MEGTNEKAAVRRVDKQIRRKSPYQMGREDGLKGLGLSRSPRDLQAFLHLDSEGLVEYLNGLDDGRASRDFLGLSTKSPSGQEAVSEAVSDD